MLRHIGAPGETVLDLGIKVFLLAVAPIFIQALFPSHSYGRGRFRDRLPKVPI